MNITPRPTLRRRIVRELHRRTLLPTLRFVWPSICAICDAELGMLCRHGVCADCWRATAAIGIQCPRCALPTADGSDLIAPDRNCGVCPAHLSQLRSVYALWRYDGPARALLLRAKLGHRFEWLDEAGRLLGRLWQLERGSPIDSIVAVPSHPLVSLHRGFSPAVELARGVARCLGQPRGRHALRKRLIAPRFAKRQSAGDRLSGGDLIRSRGRFDGQRVLLVDDVMTTGATLGHSAAALRRAGASEVHALVWARTLPRSMV